MTVVGQVVVKKGATLTILPGTTVRFAWLDEDGNGIGDGELNVEGRLVARGTRERPITFTSAREQPAPKDWTFVMISTSRESVVEHCLFEYAFTGLQVHLSSAAVRNSRFRRNFEALRFSTSEIVVERNEIAGNTYGIRYESRGSTGVHHPQHHRRQRVRLLPGRQEHVRGADLREQHRQPRRTT